MIAMAAAWKLRHVLKNLVSLALENLPDAAEKELAAIGARHGGEGGSDNLQGKSKLQASTATG